MCFSCVVLGAIALACTRAKSHFESQIDHICKINKHYVREYTGLCWAAKLTVIFDFRDSMGSGPCGRPQLQTQYDIRI